MKLWKTSQESNIKTMNNIMNRIEERTRAVSFIVESPNPQTHSQPIDEEYKKNAMTLLKKTSKDIGTKVNQLQLRNSFKKSKSIREENEKMPK